MVPSTATYDTVDDLRTWLENQGIKTDTWGAGVAKSVASLRKELKNEESTLVLEEGRPLRSLRVARVRVYRSRDDKRYIWETKQILADGTERMRGMPLSEKLKFDEKPLEAARRGIMEELEGRTGEIIGTPHETIEMKTTKTYPGLNCRYTFYEIEAVVKDLPDADSHTSFDTIESDSDKTVTHVWEWRQPLVRYIPDSGPFDDMRPTHWGPTHEKLLERLFNDCSHINVSMLQGGLSGDIVLRVAPYCYEDGDGKKASSLTNDRL